MSKARGILVLSTFPIFAGCSRPLSQADEAGVRTEIQRVLDQHGQAAMRLNASAAAVAFADDARVFFPATPEVSGRDSLTTFMARAWSSGGTPRDVQFTIDELRLFRDAALVIGTVAYTVGPEGRPPVRGKDRFMTLWTRNSVGDWTILRDMSQPAPEAAPPK